jgi:hypothetical protein
VLEAQRALSADKREWGPRVQKQREAAAARREAEIDDHRARIRDILAQAAL